MRIILQIVTNFFRKMVYLDSDYLRLNGLSSNQSTYDVEQLKTFLDIDPQAEFSGIYSPIILFKLLFYSIIIYLEFKGSVVLAKKRSASYDLSKH